MPDPIHAFDFLADLRPSQPRSFYVLFGDDRFLKCLTRQRLERDAGGLPAAAGKATAAGEEVGASHFDGAQAAWRDVIDELSTQSLFSRGPRVVIVDNADDFVSRHRGQLEELVAQPIGSGRLILDVVSFPSNLRLYKAVLEHGQLVECRAPQRARGKGSSLDEDRLCKWIVQWARSTHGIELAGGADRELVALTGTELGMIDQNLAKLALLVDADKKVDAKLVQTVVGGWRTQTTWDMMDAALEGNAGEALWQLSRLLHAGEAPQMIFGAVLWSLRRFADAATLVVEQEALGRKLSLPNALEQAGFKNWPAGAMPKAERHLRQLGRHRAIGLYHRLLETDLSLKGSHAAPDKARWAIEHLLLSLAKQNPPRAAAKGG